MKNMKIKDIIIQMINFSEKHMEKLKALAVKIKADPKMYLIALALAAAGVVAMSVF